MSRKGVRNVAARFPVKRDADGKYLCRYCEKPVKRPRLYWCSEECVQAALLACDGPTQRRAVLNRDQGVCALCGFDTAAIESAYYKAKSAIWRDRVYSHESQREGWLLEKQVDVRLKALGISGGHGHLWEVDHIVPVCEGGGELGLDNLRTACIPCHKDATAKLAARRARQRKEDAA